MTLGPDDELLVIGRETDLPERQRNVRLLDSRSPAETRAARFIYEQGHLRRAAGVADLVHLTDYRPLLLSRKPFVITVHDVFFLEYASWYPPSVAAFKRGMFAAALR